MSKHNRGCEQMNKRASLLGAAAILVLAASGPAGAGDASQTGASAVVQHAPYTWADVAKWPDIGTGIWGGLGNGPGGPAGAGGAPGGVAPGGAPPGGGPGGPPGGGPPGGGPPGGPGGRPDPFSGIPLRADFKAAATARRKQAAKSFGNCEPMGAVADSGNKFYVGRDVIVIGGLDDWYNVWRRIYMNRTSHDDPEPSYFGDSIGHWDGNTLVIDTVAVRAQAQVVQQEPVGSTNTHIVERIKLLDPNTIQWDKVVYNPDVFTKPWHTLRTLKRDSDDGDFFESYCWQDRDQGDAVDLTPPPE